MDKWSCRQMGEARTGDGRLVSYECPSGLTEMVANFLSGSVYSIGFPETHRSNVGHGGYGIWTRFNIVQHKYAGGGYPGCGGYIELLEIKNPPDGRCGFVVNSHSSIDGNSFSEWATLADAERGFELQFTADAKKFKKVPGFKRLVRCGALTPWFYAVGNQELVGSYALPEMLQNDAVYSIGRQVMVCVDHEVVETGLDEDGDPEYEDRPVWELKTCLGCRLCQYSGENQGKGRPYRVVYFDDGTVWDEREQQSYPPKVIIEDDPFIYDAFHEFVNFLQGKSEFVELRSPAGEVITFKRRRETLKMFA